MSGLNPYQREAVRFIDGPLLVLAGAGSGKTRVITQKIIYLIQQCHIQAHNIAAVTFTNKAAKEMKQRVSRELDKKLTRGLHVSTFHNLGLKIIKAEADHLGFKRDISIYDPQDCQSILKELASQQDMPEEQLEMIQGLISRWKNQVVDPAQALLAATDHAEQRGALLYAAYRRYLKACNAVDFDDLIYLPVVLFQTEPHCLEKWQNRLRYVLVDEYQDTNISQYRLIQLIVGARAALTVVGDDDQSIYAWRGAQAENLAKLKDDFPSLKVIKLEQNYRSSSCILHAANGLIANNPHIFEKKLWSELGFGEPIRIIETRNEEHEAERVIAELMQHKFQRATQFGDYAILYRGNHQSRPLERQLREQQVPYRLAGGNSFFSYTEVKDILAYLRLIANPDDNAAFVRVVNTPHRGIGASSLEKLMAYAERRQQSFCAAGYELGLAESLPERALNKLRYFIEWLANFSRRADEGEVVGLLDDLLKEIDYASWLQEVYKDDRVAERKMANIHELRDWIKQLAEGSLSDSHLSSVVSHMQLMDILDRQQQEQDDDQVSLMTMHAAKGLEFPYVFIIGAEEDILPHRTSVEQGMVEEERRLTYVGLTRAMRELTITYSARRKKAGEMQSCEPSRFLAELPENTVTWSRLSDRIDPEVRQARGRAQFDALRGMLEN